MWWRSSGALILSWERSIGERGEEMLSGPMKQKAEEILARYPENQRRSALLPLLHELQAQEGYLTAQGIEAIAEFLHLSPAVVTEVASFYDMFRLKPAGRYEIYLCHNLTCSLLGAEEILECLTRTLQVEEGGTTPDGMFTVRRFECLASCGTAPVMQVNGEYYENLTPEKALRIIEELPRMPPSGA